MGASWICSLVRDEELQRTIRLQQQGRTGAPVKEEVQVMMVQYCRRRHECDIIVMAI